MTLNLSLGLGQQLNYGAIVMDEIALEGLDGITLETLHVRLVSNPKFCLPVDDYTKTLLWEIIVSLDNVEFYTLSKERNTIPVNLGNAITPQERLEASILESEIYAIGPILKGPEVGSCAEYKTRKNVSNKARGLNYNEVCDTWGNKLVVVASVEERLKALYGTQCSPDYSDLINRFPNQYLLLELIGRSRYRGAATVGPGGTMQITKDGRTLHYLINKLIRDKIIVKNMVQNQALLRLSRFAGKEEGIVNLIVAALKKTQNGVLSKTDLYDMFPHLTQKNWKVIFHSKDFKGRVQMVRVPYRICHPEAPTDQCMKKKSGSKEKSLHAIQLKEGENEESSTKEIGDEEEICQETRITKFNFGDPIIKQIYNEILIASPMGLTQQTLTERLCVSTKMIYGILQRMVKSKTIVLKLQQIGKQRTHYYAVSEKDLKNPLVQKLKQKLEEEDELPLPAAKNLDIVLEDNPNTEKAIEIGKKSDTLQSTRAIFRMSIILQAIKAQRILNSGQIAEIVREAESNRGDTIQIDRRTLRNLLEQLASDGIIKKFVRNNILYYSDLSVDPDHCDLNVESNDNSENSQEEVMKRLLLQAEQNILEVYTVHVDTKLEKVPDFKHLPKFIRLSVLHDLIFYLTRGYSGETNKPQAEMVASLEEKIGIDPEVKAELPTLYWDHPSCYMFIPPLNSLYERVPGWFIIADIILRTPLSIFVKLAANLEGPPELRDYLDHPIRCHYPISMLPPHIRGGLCTNRNFRFIFTDVRRLSFMGLIRFGPKIRATKLCTVIMVYLNTRATILDTTPSSPAYLTIDEDKTYTSIPFYFREMADIKAYWVKLFNICLETKLGIGKLQTLKSTVREFSNERLLPLLNPIPTNEAASLDDGSIPGDHLGAGGLDSKLYSFFRSNWIVSMGSKKPDPTSLKVVKLKRRRINKKNKLIKKTNKLIKDEANEIRGKRIRASWSINEVNFLILAVAAMEFMQPHQDQALRVPFFEFRSALKRNCGRDAYDKTQAIIRKKLENLRRSGMLSKTSDLIKLFRKSPQLLEFQMPDNLNDTQVGTSNRKEFLSNLSKKFHPLIDLIVEKFLDNGNILQLQEDEIPDTLEELHKMYDFSVPPTPKYTMAKIKEDAVRALAMSSLVSSQSEQLFEVYQQFDGTVLTDAMDRLRKQQIVTIRRKVESDSITKTILTSQARYRFTKRFAFVLNTKYHQAVYHEAYAELNKLLCCPVHNSTELNLKICGPAVFPLSCLGYVKLSATIPDQFVSLDSKFVSSAMGAQILSRFSHIMKSSDPVQKVMEENSEPSENEPPKKKVCRESSTIQNEENSFLNSLLNTQMDVDEPVNLSSEPENDIDDAENKIESFNITDTLENDTSAGEALMILRELVLQEIGPIGGPKAKPIDFFLVATSKVNCSPNQELSRDYGSCDKKSIKKILQIISDPFTIPLKLDNEEEVMADLISTCTSDQTAILESVLALCTAKGVTGATVNDVLTLGSKSSVVWAVNRLVSRRLLFRFGIWDHRFVTSQFIDPWTIKCSKVQRQRSKPSNQICNDDKTVFFGKQKTLHQRILMRPWLRIDGTPNRRMLDRLLGTLVGKVMLSPGLSEASLAVAMAPALSHLWTYELIQVLDQIGCISRRVVRRQKATLFNKGSLEVCDIVTELESPEDIIIDAKPDAIIKLGQFIGNKLYSKDILSK